MAISSSDKRDIEEALCRVYDAIDGNHDAKRFAACFTEDGAFRTKYGDFKGHAQITEFLLGHIARGAEDGARHVLTNFIIDETPQGAQIRCYLLKVVNDDLRLWLAGTSWINAQMVQSEGRWLVADFDLKIALQKPQGPFN